MTAIRDSGAGDTIISKGLLRFLTGVEATPIDREFRGLGASGPSKYLGVVKPMTLRLTPQLAVDNWYGLVSSDEYCVMLLGTDLFNREMVETLGWND